MKSNENNKTWISNIVVRNIFLCLKQVYCCLTFVCMYIYKAFYDKSYLGSKTTLTEYGHAWFHLHGIHWAVRNRLGLKNSKWKYMSPVGFEPTPRHAMAGETAFQTARPQRLDDNQWINVLQDIWIKLIKPLRDNTCQIDYGYLCIYIWTECQTKSTFLLSM